MNEQRTITCKVTFDPESRSGPGVLKGHAAVVGVVSHDLGFREKVAPKAFANAIRKGGTRLVYNHGGQTLASVKAGTLKLSEDNIGLAFEANVVNTTHGRDMLELCRTGHVNECSWAFTIARDKWTRQNGEDHREILEVGDLIDVSVVDDPAYPSTDVSADARDLVLRNRRRGTGADPYAEGSGNMYFRDLWVSQESERRRLANTNVVTFGRDPGDPNIPAHGMPSPEEANARLAQCRALNIIAGNGGEGIPAGVPPALSDAFATAARANGVLPQALGSEELPKGAGLTMKIPGFNTGATVGVQAIEGEAVSETKPTTEYLSSGVVLLSGSVLVTQQVFDLGGSPGTDAMIAAELGAALALRRDVQILNGTGSSKQTLGLLNVTGVTKTTFTQATPTAQQFIREGIGANWSAVALALGKPADTILMGTTRYSWLYSGYDTTNKRPIDPDVLDAFAPPVQVPVLSTLTTLGANNNEEPVLTLNKDQVRIYLNAPQLIIAPQEKAGNLEVRITIRQLCAVVVRKPVGVGVILGTGLKASPAFT